MSGYKIQDDAKRWSNALENVGVDFVRQSLRERPDRSPDETFHDIVPNPPYPTRRFVQDWVIQQENRIIRFSSSTLYIVGAAVLVLILVWFAVDSMDSAVPPPPYNPAPIANTNTSR